MSPRMRPGTIRPSFDIPQAAPSVVPRWTPPGPGRIHPLASIGDAPEHRDYISGKLGPALPPEIGRDCVISAFVTVDCGLFEPTRIGDRCLLMTKCHVGHDAQIGDDVEIGVGAVISGHVRIGDGAKIHGNASIRPGITIGAGARIGLGAVVVKDVPAGEVWAGVPARRLERGRVATEMAAPALMPLHQYATRSTVVARGIPLPGHLPVAPAPDLTAEVEQAREEHAEACIKSRDAWRDMTGLPARFEQIIGRPERLTS